MEFSNERTWLSAAESGAQEEFPPRFEAAVYKAREHLGATHPIHIGDDAIRVRQTFEDRSPGDLRVLVGRFALATRGHAAKAIPAPGAADRPWARTDARGRAR